MRIYRLLYLPVLLAVFCFSSGFATAQSVYGSVKGTLTDISGKPISGAKVTVSSVGKGTRYRTVSDGTGFYTVNDVSPDDYSLRIEADGFKTYQNPLVTVYADNPSVVNSRLAKGSSTEVITGSAADVSVLKIDRTDVATILSQRQVADLPVLEQNVSNLEILAPGAISVAPTLSVIQNPQQGVYFDINGQIFSGTAYQLDGTDNRDPIEGLVVINPNQDSVGEMKITTQNYGAEFGEATAGVVTAQTKSGSNSWHGSAFGYRQSGWGQASDPNLFTTVPTTNPVTGSTSTFTVPPEINDRTYKKNQFGGSIGGPIIKNRLFFFADYRGTRDTSGATLTLTVPTALVRNTCLGPVTGAPTDCNLSEYGVPLNTKLKSPSPFLKGDSVVDTTNPTVCDANTPTSACLFNSQVSPQMVYLMSLLPMPSAPGITNNYQAAGTEPFNSDNSDLRLDYDASRRLKLFARYSYDLFRENGSPAFGIGGGPGTNPDLFAGSARTANQGISSGFSYSFSGSLLTDFRFGFLHFHLDMNAPDFGTYPLLNPPSAYAGDSILGLNCTGHPTCTPDLFASGLPDVQIISRTTLGGANQAPPPTTGDFLDFGNVSVQGNLALPCNCPLREHEQQFQWVNNWTRLAGHHAFRWGADFRYIQNFRLTSYGGGSTSRAGLLQFSDNTFTNLGLGDYLVGMLAYFDRTYSDPTANPSAYNATEQQKRAFFYGEDTWRVSSRLTLNYGLRWELYFPQSVNANAGGFLLIKNDTLPGFNGATINEPGTSGVNPQGNVQNTFKNFGPRIGFAYLAGSKTVIRAGYGRSFDVGYEGSLFGIAATQNPPIAAHFEDRNGSATSGFVLNDNNGTSTPPVLDLSSFTNFTIAASPFTVQGLCNAQFANQPASGSPIIPCSVPDAANSKSPEAGTALYALPARIRVPTVDAWNFTVQHELTPNSYFELAYVGNKGTHVLTDSSPYYDLNAPCTGQIAPAASGNCSLAAQPVAEKIGGTTPCNTIGGGSSFCLPRNFTLTPLTPWIFPVYYFGNNASDNYNSLQAKFSKRFSAGYSLLAHYVYSKVLDYDSSYFAVDPGRDYGPGDFDRRQSFAMSNSWTLPIGRGRALLSNLSSPADKAVGGWSLYAITSWYSGLPFNPTYGQEQLTPGTSGCYGDLSSDVLDTPPCLPLLAGSVSVTGSRNQYFTTTGGLPLPPGGATVGSDPSTWPLCGVDASGNPLPGPQIGPWQRPGCGQIGNVGRNSLRGPQFFQSDIALMKEIALTERVALRFRADAFNIFNKVNLGLPNTQVDALTQAGAITTIAPGAIQRQWEFSARLQF